MHHPLHDSLGSSAEHLGPAIFFKARAEVVRQPGWASSENLCLEIDLGELWVRMRCFEDLHALLVCHAR